MTGIIESFIKTKKYMETETLLDKFAMSVFTSMSNLNENASFARTAKLAYQMAQSMIDEKERLYEESQNDKN